MALDLKQICLSEYNKRLNNRKKELDELDVQIRSKRNELVMLNKMIEERKKIPEKKKEAKKQAEQQKVKLNDELEQIKLMEEEKDKQEIRDLMKQMSMAQPEIRTLPVVETEDVLDNDFTKVIIERDFKTGKKSFMMKKIID